MNSLFHFFESLIAHIQAGDEIAEAEKRLNFELYGVHPFDAHPQIQIRADRLMLIISNRF